MSTAHRVTHPLNVTYLVVGLVFLGISGSWALRTAGLVDSHQIGWLLPTLLVVAGAVGLVASTAKGLSRSRQSDETQDPTLSDGPDVHDHLGDHLGDHLDDRGDLR